MKGTFARTNLGPGISGEKLSKNGRMKGQSKKRKHDELDGVSDDDKSDTSVDSD